MLILRLWGNERLIPPQKVRIFKTRSKSETKLSKDKKKKHIIKLKDNNNYYQTLESKIYFMRGQDIYDKQGSFSIYLHICTDYNV